MAACYKHVLLALIDAIALLSMDEFGRNALLTQRRSTRFQLQRDNADIKDFGCARSWLFILLSAE